MIQLAPIQRASCLASHCCATDDAFNVDDTNVLWYDNQTKPNKSFRQLPATD